MKRLALCLPLLLLTGCPTKTPSGSPVLSLAPSAWTMLNSSASGDPTHPQACAGYDWCEPFPISSASSLNYLTTPYAAPGLLGKTLTMTFVISTTGTPYLQPANNETYPFWLHLFLWQAGDNMTGVGQYAFYRWWATICGTYALTDNVGHPLVVSGQIITLSCPLTYTNWTGVTGTESQSAFAGTMANLYAVGLTAGGVTGAGHGLYAIGGTMDIDLVSVTIQ